MIIITMSCDGAQDDRASITLEEKREEISPRDQEQQSPRRKVFMSRQPIDLRKVIAYSSPRRSGSRDLNEREVSAEDNASREASPRSLTRSKSTVLPSFQEKENKNLKDVLEIEKAGSPRGEGLVLGLLRTTGGFDRRKSAPNVIVNFEQSSPPISHILGYGKDVNSPAKESKLSESISVQDQDPFDDELFRSCIKKEEPKY